MRRIEIRDVQFYVDDPAHENHWDKYENGQWQPWIFPIYDRLLDQDRCYIDFGAWIGGTTLYASRKARHCYAFEPDPVAFKLLHRNMDCNPDIDNITLVNSAIWNETKIVSMSSETGGLGNSDTSIMLNNPDAMTIASAIRFSDFRASPLLNVKDYTLIKFDIEGAEFVVMKDMLDFFEEVQPSIILSPHNDRIDNPQERMKEIKSMLGFYSHFYNAEDMSEVESEFFGSVLITNEEWK